MQCTLCDNNLQVGVCLMRASFSCFEWEVIKAASIQHSIVDFNENLLNIVQHHLLYSVLVLDLHSAHPRTIGDDSVNELSMTILKMRHP